LSRVDGNSEALLTGCTGFQFAVYQRTPKSNDSGLFPTWDTNTAKVVQMNWTCIRSVTGDKSAVESQVSSRVVVRNQ
jgi:hypothetical protein